MSKQRWVPNKKLHKQALEYRKEITEELNRTGVLSQDFQRKTINYIDAIFQTMYDAGCNPEKDK